MIIAIPGGVACLSWLQEQIQESGERSRRHTHLHKAIDDFRWLARHIGSRPTRIAEVFPGARLFIGGSDPAGPDMGDVRLELLAEKSGRSVEQCVRGIGVHCG